MANRFYINENMQMPRLQPEKIPPIEITPRKMYRELAKIFHADVGGDNESMVELNAANEKFIKDGDDGVLRKIYEAKFGRPAVEIDPEKLIASEMEALNRVIYNDLLQERGSLVDAIGKFKEKYKVLCDRTGAEYNAEYLALFLLKQGWITEDEFRDEIGISKIDVTI